jgi:hypothetical protein
MNARIATSYSADVRMSLAVNGHVFSIAELGPGFVVLRDAVDHPPVRGEITMSIDRHVEKWLVELVDGIKAGGGDTRIARPAN